MVRLALAVASIRVRPAPAPARLLVDLSALRPGFRPVPAPVLPDCSWLGLACCAEIVSAAAVITHTRRSAYTSWRNLYRLTLYRQLPRFGGRRS